MSKYYTDEFKREIVFLRKSGKSVKWLNETYGLGKNTVALWEKLFDVSGNLKPKPKIELTKEQIELKSLRKEVKAHSEDIILLKQAFSVLLKKKT